MAQRTLRRTKPRDRRAKDPSIPTRRTPAIILSLTAVTETEVRVEFDTRVQVSRTPGFVAGASGKSAVKQATLEDPTLVTLKFEDAVADSTMLIGEYDPGIRTASGGFVPAGRYVIPPVA